MTDDVRASINGKKMIYRKMRRLGQFDLHKWESDTRTEKEMIGKGMTSEGQYSVSRDECCNK